MANYKNKKKMIIAGGVYFIAALVIVMGITCAQYRDYNKKYNQKLNEMCNKIERKYPQITSREIMSIINNSEQQNENIPDYFMKYGIDIDNDSVIRESEKIFQRYLYVGIILLVIWFLSGCAFVLGIEEKRARRINRIANYLKNINQGDYRFDMEASAEGELSILESEVYKTTIMLKENADNSKLDKQKLKDALSDISHQLKTPITSLVINLENLENHPDMEKDKRNHIIGNAKRDTNRISMMVQQLLTLSKIDANVIEFKKEKIKLNDIVSEAISNVEALADLLSITIYEENIIDSQNYIVCDGYWEKQAITNVLKNGIEHAKSKVNIRYMNCELYKEIVIENDGKPINEQDRKNIFNRFYRGSNSSKDSVGIGLALANAVIKNDGGYIVVESDEHLPENGVKFIIRYV